MDLRKIPTNRKTGGAKTSFTGETKHISPTHLETMRDEWVRADPQYPTKGEYRAATTLKEVAVTTLVTVAAAAAFGVPLAPLVIPGVIGAAVALSVVTIRSSFASRIDNIQSALKHKTPDQFEKVRRKVSLSCPKFSAEKTMIRDKSAIDPHGPLLKSMASEEIVTLANGMRLAVGLGPNGEVQQSIPLAECP